MCVARSIVAAMRSDSDCIAVRLGADLQFVALLAGSAKSEPSIEVTIHFIPVHSVPL